jgi:hypothetical protein
MKYSKFLKEKIRLNFSLTDTFRNKKAARYAAAVLPYLMLAISVCVTLAA